MERIIKTALGYYKRLKSDNQIEWTKNKAEAMPWSSHMINSELQSGRLSMEFEVLIRKEGPCWKCGRSESQHEDSDYGKDGNCIVTKEQVECLENYGSKNWKTFKIQGDNLTIEQSDRIHEKLVEMVNVLEDEGIGISQLIAVETKGDLIES